MRADPEVVQLGAMEFGAAFLFQERLVAEIAAGARPETLLLLEHPPVYTIGSGGDAANVLDPAVMAVRTNRGGDVTWHGPGQLVGYPLVNLARRGRDLHRYLRFIEEFLIGVAAEFGVAAARVPGRTGVWTERGKLASIGVGVRRWVTMHGFALNIAPDLTAFDRINPCGIRRCPITSLALETGHAGSSSVAAVSAVAARTFPRLLGARLPVTEGG